MRPLEKISAIVTKAIVALVIGLGVVLLLVPLKPFEVDEWRLIYNLKFKDSHALWGQLDFVQQFPRVYLQLVKGITRYFGYSYTSLRLPSFIVGTCAIALGYRLMQRLFPADNKFRYLFVLILISSHTFVTYYLQVKQYTMDIFLSMVAIWQLVQLLKLAQTGKLRTGRYLLLVLTFCIAPFFSYTYPIVVAPVFVVAMLQTIQLVRSHANGAYGTVAKMWVPLVLCMMSLAAFFITDAAQVNKDTGMQQYWNYLMMQHGFNVSLFFKGFYLLFAEMGAGLLFEIIFGVLGMAAFVMGVVTFAKQDISKPDTLTHVRLYSILLLSFTLLLYAAGKLPVGEPRLNAFAVMAIAVLIISLLDKLSTMHKGQGTATTLFVLLMLGAVGHIITSPIHDLSGKEHEKKIAIYRNTQAAIALAREKKLPIMITSDAAFPSEKMICYPKSNVVAYTMCCPPTHEGSLHFNIAEDMPGDWVLKTLPAYKAEDRIPVYAISDTSKAADYIKLLPGSPAGAVVGNGVVFRVVGLGAYTN